MREYAWVLLQRNGERELGLHGTAEIWTFRLFLGFGKVDECAAEVQRRHEKHLKLLAYVKFVYIHASTSFVKTMPTCITLHTLRNTQQIANAHCTMQASIGDVKEACVQEYCGMV